MANVPFGGTGSFEMDAASAAIQLKVVFCGSEASHFSKPLDRDPRMAPICLLLYHPVALIAPFSAFGEAKGAEDDSLKSCRGRAACLRRVER